MDATKHEFCALHCRSNDESEAISTAERVQDLSPLHEIVVVELVGECTVAL